MRSSKISLRQCAEQEGQLGTDHAQFRFGGTFGGRQFDIDNMADESLHSRLPTTDARRIARRDAKMWLRETERQQRTRQARSRCPCSLCLFGRPLLRTTHAKHLRDFGRHPQKRLQPEVRDGTTLSVEVCVCTFCAGRVGGEYPQIWGHLPTA